MTVGMAVDIPSTEEQRRNLRKLILLLDEAAVYASDANLWIAGHFGPEFLGAITSSLMETWRESKEGTDGDISTQT